jgi:superfamily II DNA or RNA helicase
MTLNSPNFAWDRFDPATLEAFARVLDYEGVSNHASRATYLKEKYQNPTLDFVSRVFHVIQNIWFRRNENVATAVVDALIKNGVGPREKPRNHIERVRFLSQCPNRHIIRAYFRNALLKYGGLSGWTDDAAFQLDTAIPRLTIIRPLEQTSDVREPYEYQKKAWEELNLQLALAEASGRFDGFLVMPTGSGKTFTTARWLMESHVNKGGRVLWLAHRHELLEQAAQAFASCASFARNIDEIRIRIVSGCHCPASSIGEEDTILCCSVQSLARNSEVVSELIRDENLFLVVDEAHHASAKSYRDIIEDLRRRERFRLLGLTATPTRTLVHEQPILSRLFGNKKIYEIETRDLIEKGFLARPIPVIVKTDSDIESQATAEDFKHLQEFKDLSEAWKNRIANITERNEAITRHYTEHREKYGKTLVFAINIPHAELLCERLREAGIETDYVASYRLNGAAYDKRAIVDRFRDPKSGFDVLVNVMILTEGVDIPNVKTVFLTRPVRSEILLRQMVGRALRGPAAGGTKEAYFVSFEDRWREFEEWERPLDLLQDLMDTQVETDESIHTDPAQQKQIKALAEVIPWELIRQTSLEIRRLASFGDVSSFEAVPAGWYILIQEDDDDIQQTLVPVYLHQQSCWDALLSDIENGKTAEDQTLEELREEYFFDCDIPRPASHHIDAVVAATRRDRKRPDFQELEGRQQCDPIGIAEEIWDRQFGPLQIDQLLTSRYAHTLTKAIFASYEEFRDIVQKEINNLTLAKTGRRRSLGTVEFQPWGSAQLSPGPFHDLNQILLGVLEKGSQIFQREKLPWSGTISWTRRPIKGWYGKAFYQEQSPQGSGEIRINCLLDSPDISKEAMEFLVWHEYLHLFLQVGHPPLFKKYERKWPTSRQGERELETLNERFEVHFYW